MNVQHAEAEWLEADGLGGFASGTVGGIRTRRYHGLLLVAVTPPTGRMMLVNGCDAWVDTPEGIRALSSQRYRPDVVHPDGASRLMAFSADPWPRWTYAVSGSVRIIQELFVVPGVRRVVVTFRVEGPVSGVRLRVRPFLSGRDYHSMHHANGAFRFEADRHGAALVWRPYDGVPGVVSASNGAYEHAPDWFRDFLYSAERERGLDDTEDLASPGVLSWDMARVDEAVWVLGTEDSMEAFEDGNDVLTALRRWRTAERRRRTRLPSPLERAVDAYLVRRGRGRTVMAGYPWFTDWGRDTFIAMRGLCLATGRLVDARDILLEWSGAVSQGMLPNRFPDSGQEAEYNAVDASLWFIVACHELLEMAETRPRLLTRAARARLSAAIEQVLEGYAAGTRHGIRCDDDGLLAAGEPGVQLTWMDAKLGDWVVTPRVGKPVEVQALWINALAIAARHSPRWASRLAQARRSFDERFWNPAGGLYDVVDVNHRLGDVDVTCRPNQIFAVGGLPMSVLQGDRARTVVDIVEQRLLAPLGLRSLAPGEPGYVAHYEGSPWSRDSAYHQGTVWPWLIGAFIDAWVRVRGGGLEAAREARERFMTPLVAHLGEAGLGHVSEITDAESPFTPRGCPFQAWSLGELIRADRLLVAAEGRASGR